jgi:hypothetical protein
LWLSYDFYHFLVLLIIVIVIDNLYDDNLYPPIPPTRRRPVPYDFLLWHGLRRRDYHWSRLRVGGGRGLLQIGNARRQTGRTHIRQWRRIG